jgi:bla regulator protein blaR1
MGELRPLMLRIADHSEGTEMSDRTAGANFDMKALWLVATWMVLGVTHLHGQILHPAGPLPSFEVATIKPSNGGNAIPSISTPSESRTIDVTARNLIEQAYNIPWTPGLNQRVVGGPGWIDNDRYDVEARIDESLVATLGKMSKEQQKEQASLMMQSLLADRFKLKVHFESRELPVYALVVAKGGAKLAVGKESSPATEDKPSRPDVGFPTGSEDLLKGLLVVYRGQTAEMTAKAATLDELVHWFAGYSEIGGRTVVNQTALHGNYDFTLHWTRERLTAPAQQGSQPSTLSTDPDGPPLFTALQEQLGLRLVSTKAPVEVLVIDYIERPSEN